MGTFPCASLSQQSSKFAEVEIMGSVLSSRIGKFFLSLGGLRRCKCSMTGSPARQEALLLHFEGAIDVCCSFWNLWSSYQNWKIWQRGTDALNLILGVLSKYTYILSAVIWWNTGSHFRPNHRGRYEFLQSWSCHYCIYIYFLRC